MTAYVLSIPLRSQVAGLWGKAHHSSVARGGGLPDPELDILMGDHGNAASLHSKLQ